MGAVRHPPPALVLTARATKPRPADLVGFEYWVTCGADEREPDGMVRIPISTCEHAVDRQVAGCSTDGMCPCLPACGLC